MSDNEADPDNPHPIGPGCMKLFVDNLQAPNAELVLQTDFGKAQVQRRDGGGLLVLVTLPLGGNYTVVLDDDASTKLNVSCVNYAVSEDERWWDMTIGGCSKQTPRTRNKTSAARRRVRASKFFTNVEFTSTEAREKLNNALCKAISLYDEARREREEDEAIDRERAGPPQSWMQRTFPGLF